MDFVPTICPYCGTGCGLLLVVNDGKVVGVEPWAKHPISENKLCIKGWQSHEFVNHPDRLTKPLVKQNGVFQETTWETAVDIVTRKLAEMKVRRGPEAVTFLTSAKCTNEDNYILQKLARLFGSPSVDHCARL